MSGLFKEAGAADIFEKPVCKSETREYEAKKHFSVAGFCGRASVGIGARDGNGTITRVRISVDSGIKVTENSDSSLSLEVQGDYERMLLMHMFAWLQQHLEADHLP